MTIRELNDILLETAIGLACICGLGLLFSIASAFIDWISRRRRQ